MKSSEFKAYLLERGWVEDRWCKGSHLRFRFPSNGQVMLIPAKFRETSHRVANMQAEIRRKEKMDGPPMPIGATMPKPKDPTKEEPAIQLQRKELRPIKISFTPRSAGKTFLQKFQHDRYAEAAARGEKPEPLEVRFPILVDDAEPTIPPSSPLAQEKPAMPVSTLPPPEPVQAPETPAAPQEEPKRKLVSTSVREVVLEAFAPGDSFRLKEVYPLVVQHHGNLDPQLDNTRAALDHLIKLGIISSAPSGDPVKGKGKPALIYTRLEWTPPPAPEAMSKKDLHARVSQLEDLVRKLMYSHEAMKRRQAWLEEQVKP